MNLEQEQDRIQQYFAGTLPPDERAALERDAAHSPELAEMLRHFRQLRIMRKHHALIEGKALLDNVMEETPVSPDYGAHEHYFSTPFWKSGAIKWLIGAFLLIASIAGGTWYAQKQQQEALFTLSKGQTQPLENLIGFAPEDRSAAASGMAAYDRRAWSEAIPLLQAAIEESPDDNSLRLYLAVSYLMKGETAPAREELERLAHQDGLTAVPAQWYLALTLMQQNKKEQAKVLLQGIAADTIYGAKAREILREMNE